MVRHPGRAGQRGVSLIEAMIAMAVMGFGMLAIVGVQSNLRFNADMSKQRAEATRIAEQELESIRAFSKVASVDGSEKEFDKIASKPEVVISGTQYNAEFLLKRDVIDVPDGISKVPTGISKMIAVVVKWQDRTGETREISMHDMITRVDPMLSGFVKAERPLTGIGRRNGRHPTIPSKAVDLPGGSGSGKSIFLPPNASGIGWVFNNGTGAITHTCTSVITVSESTLANNCTELKDVHDNLTPAQLVSGQIRFNLRGASHSPTGGAISFLKPAPDGDAAWVIDHGTSKLIHICPVPLTKSTTDLLADEVDSDCKNADTKVAPFSPTDGSDLSPTDSEDPQWPTLPATVELDLSWAHRSLSSGFECYADYQTSVLAHTLASPARTWIEYFCIVKVPDDKGWGGRTVVKPLTFTDTFGGGTGATWKTGTQAGTYRVCRYTHAADDYTDNDDHPATYSVDAASCMSPTACRPVRGNLINQNFLVIDGTKTCPQESTPVNPASGNFVNSNTRQHQPVP